MLWINRLLELLEKMINNKYFLIKSNENFNLLTNTFIMISVDCNLFSIDASSHEYQSGDVDCGQRDSIRLLSAQLLRRLLETKVGKYHSVTFIDELVGEYLTNLIDLLLNRFRETRIDSIKSALLGSIFLMCEMVSVNKSMSLGEDRIAYLQTIQRRITGIDGMENASSAIDNVLVDLGK
jgi:hypothetical protein